MHAISCKAILSALSLIFFSGLLAVLPANTLHAQDRMSAAELAEKVMEASGFSHSLHDVWIGMESGVEDEQHLPSEKLQKTRQILRSGFHGDRLVTLFADRLARNMDHESAEAVLVFLQTETGREITEAEKSELNATEDELIDYMESLESGSTRHQKRVEYVVNIIEETKAVENTVEILFAMYSNLLLAVNAVEEPERRMSSRDFEETTELIRMQLRHQMNQYVTMNMLYTFRELDISHLETYVAYLRSPAGRWYTGTLHEILMDVLDNAHTQVRTEVDRL